MKKFLSVIFISFVAVCQLNAQTVGVKGIIKDKDGIPLEQVYVRDTLSNTSVFSNDKGEYSLALEKGNHVIEMRHFGYEKQVFTITLSNAYQTLDVMLQELNIVLEEIVIERNEVVESINSVEMSTDELSIDEIRKIPTILGEVDLINAIKLLPGVSSLGEGATGFNVRGGNIDQNLLLADNANVFVSSHLFGFFSVFNPDAVSGLKLYKGAIPSMYGERVSSVLVIDQKSGSFEKIHVNGGIGMLSSRLTIEGPIIKNKLSFLLSARRSYADKFLLLSRDTMVRNTRAFYRDLNAKFAYVLNKNNSFTLTLYQGRDMLDLNKGSSLFFWGNSFAVLNSEHKLSTHLTMKNSFSISEYRYYLGQEKGFKWESSIQTVNEKFNFEYSKFTKHAISFGLHNNNHLIKPATVTTNPKSQFNFDKFVVPNQKAYESALFLQDDYKLNDKFLFQGGLRFSMYNTHGKETRYVYQSGEAKQASTIIDTINYKRNQISSLYKALEPRFGMRYKIDSVSAIKFSYCRNVQYMQLVSNTASGLPLDIWKLADYNVKPLISNQVAIGYNRAMFKNKYELTLETYYKKLDNVLDYKDNAELLLKKQIETELLQGVGKSYGMEFMLRKRGGRFNGWISYTLSNSRYLVTSDIAAEKINNGYWYPANFNKPHNLAVVLSYEFSKRVTASFNFVYSSGRPLTLPVAKYSVFGRDITDYSGRNESKMEDYHRADINFDVQSKKNSIRKYQKYWSLSVYNLYARKNAYAYINSPGGSFGASKTYKVSLLGSLIPAFTYNFKF